LKAETFYFIVIFTVIRDAKIYSCMDALTREQIVWKKGFSHFYFTKIQSSLILIFAISKFRNKKNQRGEWWCGKNSNL